MNSKISFKALAATNTPHWVYTGIANTILANGHVPNYDGGHRSCKSEVARFLASSTTRKHLKMDRSWIVMFGIYMDDEFVFPGEMSHIIVTDSNMEPICDSNKNGKVLVRPNGVVEYEYPENGVISTQRMFTKMKVAEFWHIYIRKGVSEETLLKRLFPQ